jgi:kynureninase
MRDRFATINDSSYLVSHSMGAAPLAARAALDAYWRQWAAEGPEAWQRWLPQIQEIADDLGAIIGAPAGTVYLAPNVSLLQSAIASSLNFAPPRNEVVYEQLQFPSLTYVWTAWQRAGADVRVIPSDDGRTIPTERILVAITERTAVAVLSHAYYVSGAVCDARAIQAHCRRTGTLLVLDAYQTTGVYPYDVTQWDLDIVVGGSHKWLCGGPGCAWIYVRPSLRQNLQPFVTGWMAHAQPFAFEPAPIRYAESMARWNAGTPPMPGYLVAKTGHDAIREAGVETIRSHNVRLTNRIAEQALQRKLNVTTPLDPKQRTGWIGFDFDGAERIERALAQERIFVDYRPHCGIRVGPHMYTADEDIDRFFAALDRLRATT